MTDLKEKWFHGVELSAYGLSTPRVSGVHDLAEVKVARTWIPARDYPSDQDVYRGLVTMSLGCVLAKDSHEELVTALKNLRALMDPALGWGEFRIEDRPGERTIARSLGFGISIDALPYEALDAEWEWKLERYGWWEDLTELTAADRGLLASSNLVINPRPIHTAGSAPTGWSTNDGNSVYTWTNGAAHDGITTKHVHIAGGAGASTVAGIKLHDAVNSECAPADVIQVSATIGACTLTGTAGLRFVMVAYKDDNTYIATVNGSETLTPGAGFVTYSDDLTAPALCTKFGLYLCAVGDFENGDTQEYSICEVLAEVAVDRSPYFDGTMPGCTWTGTPDASISTRAAGSVNNTGKLDAYPTYTCTVTDTLASGLTFTVGGVTFTYTGALVATDVLEVMTDLPDVEKNGTRDFANTGSAAEFPTLSPGSNTVTKSSPDFTLDVAFRRRNP